MTFERVSVHDTPPAVLFRLIDLAYESVASPRTWDTFLATLASTVGADQAVLSEARFDGRSPLRLRACDPELAGSFIRRYATSVEQNPHLVPGLALPIGRTMNTDAHLNFAHLARTDYYNTVLRPFGFDHRVFLRLGNSPHTGVHITRHARWGPFDPRACEILETLAPHIARAMKLSEHFVRPGAHVPAVTRALAQLDTMLIVVDAGHRMLEANDIGERVLQRGRVLQHGRDGLIASDWLQTKHLHEAIAAAVRTICEQSTDCGQPIELRSDDGSTGWQIVAVPLPRKETIWGSGDPRVALIGRSVTPRPTREGEISFRAQYGLTPAEAELATLLSRGMTVREAAEKRGTSVKTIRNQLRGLFRKTATSRQAELVRKLLERNN